MLNYSMVYQWYINYWFINGDVEEKNIDYCGKPNMDRNIGKFM